MQLLSKDSHLSRFFSALGVSSQLEPFSTKQEEKPGTETEPLWAIGYGTAGSLEIKKLATWQKIADNVPPASIFILGHYFNWVDPTKNAK